MWGALHTVSSPSGVAMSVWTLLTLLLWGVHGLMLPTLYNGFWTPKAMLVLLGVWAIVSSAWWNPPTRTAMLNRWMGLLFVWWLLFFGWKVLLPQILVPNSVERTLQLPWIYYPIWPTIIALGSLLAIDTLVRHTDSLERWVGVAATLCYIGGALAFYALCQQVNLDPLQLGPHASIGYLSRHAMITTFGNPMLTANTLAIIAPLCLMFRPGIFRVIYAMIAVVLVMVFSTTSLVAFLVSSTCFFMFQRQWKRLLWVGGVCLAGMAWSIMHPAFWHTFLNFSGRWDIWQRTLALWRAQAPWMGFGLGSMEFACTRGLWTWASAHNEWIQILFETGLIGLGLAIMAAGSTVWHVWQEPKYLSLTGWFCAAIAFGIVSTFSFPLRIGSMLLIGVCIWAALEAHRGGTDAAQVSA